MLYHHRGTEFTEIFFLLFGERPKSKTHSPLVAGFAPKWHPQRKLLKGFSSPASSALWNAETIPPGSLAMKKDFFSASSFARHSLSGDGGCVSSHAKA